jgi:hypothetical protein
MLESKQRTRAIVGQCMMPHGFLLRVGVCAPKTSSKPILRVSSGQAKSVASVVHPGVTWVLLAPAAKGRLADIAGPHIPCDGPYGDGPVRHLDGVFALVRIEEEANRVSVWNDPLGVQAVYYTITGNNECVISNHLAWLLLSVGHRGTVNREAWLEHMCFGYCAAGGQTAYEGIQQLEPGTVLSLQDGKMGLRRYWRPRYWAGNGGAPSLGLEEAADLAAEILRKETRKLNESGGIFGLTSGKDSLALISSSGQAHHETSTFGAPDCADVQQAALIAADLGGAHAQYPLLGANEIVSWAEHVAWHSGGLATCSYSDMAAFVAQAIPLTKCFVMGEGGECVRNYLGENPRGGMERLVREFTTPEDYIKKTLNGIYGPNVWSAYPEHQISVSLSRLDPDIAQQHPGIGFYREVRMPGNFRLRHSVLSPICAKASPFLTREFMEHCFPLPPEYFHQSSLHRGIIAASRPGLLHYFDAPVVSSTPAQDWPARMAGPLGQVFRASVNEHLSFSNGAVSEDGVRSLVEASAVKPGREIYHLMRLWSYLLFQRLLAHPPVNPEQLEQSA